jgi:hypothetical protein
MLGWLIGERLLGNEKPFAFEDWESEDQNIGVFYSEIYFSLSRIPAVSYRH